MVIVATVVAGVSLLARSHESILVRTILVDRTHVVVLFAERPFFPLFAWIERQTAMVGVSTICRDDDDCSRLRWNEIRKWTHRMGVRSLEHSKC